MLGNLILRGIVVGIFAGLIAFAWARVFGEPAVEQAIAFESAQGEAPAGEHSHDVTESSGHSHSHDGPESFSRSVQSGIGLLAGIVAIGASLGGLFAILFAYANGRMGALGPAPTSALLALLGLLSVYLVPALKYPANPPATGDADTLQLRTALYFLMVAISIAATLGALALRSRWARHHGTWNGSLMAAGAYLLAISIAFLVLPGINEIPAHFPAATLWEFRLASMSTQTVMWMSLGILFGFVGEWSVPKAARSVSGVN